MWVATGRVLQVGGIIFFLVQNMLASKDISLVELCETAIVTFHKFAHNEIFIIVTIPTDRNVLYVFLKCAPRSGLISVIHFKSLVVWLSC